MSIERLERWCEQLEMKKQYFSKRKKWARRMVSEHNLTKTGDQITAKYWDREYTIKIGPRGGIQILGPLPWQEIDGWQWFEKSASQRKKG